MHPAGAFSCSRESFGIGTGKDVSSHFPVRARFCKRRISEALLILKAAKAVRQAHVSMDDKESFDACGLIRSNFSSALLSDPEEH